MPCLTLPKPVFAFSSFSHSCPRIFDTVRARIKPVKKLSTRSRQSCLVYFVVYAMRTEENGSHPSHPARTCRETWSECCGGGYPVSSPCHCKTGSHWHDLMRTTECSTHVWKIRLGFDIGVLQSISVSEERSSLFVRESDA
jgi:hypothetical protein